MTDVRRPTSEQVRRWRGYLADERAEAAVYRDLASRRTGPDREILLELADAEGRHEQHWVELLGGEATRPTRVGLRTRLLGFLARRFGTVFVLALLQRAEGRSPYADELDATPQMAADERIHEEVVRSLAMRGRNRISGTFRAAVFGANDGLVSNLALVLGVGATGVDTRVVLFTGVAGVLAGALSMGAGEYVSVSSQRELLRASTPSAASRAALHLIDLDENEVALVFRARGMSAAEADAEARALLTERRSSGLPDDEVDVETIGTPFGVALSSFAFFASGAIVPILPYVFGMSGLPAVLLAAALVGIVLLCSGAVVGLLSGAPMVARALRQLSIGWGAAAVTYLLGLGFDALTH
ncbi:VIT1/CCC1 family protein [Amnibacterium sp. CER49]|uniref:VIT1/CCC1 transporter family protein n=1 Tax=Amnibacterium sp. CER49 TaxID=3039161 RepID=UPI002449903F|nr:VIT1/CCC1 family protein [Amnibacterium sp. CER49]MDH2444454.1 VIT1/CCC1 family protein [Amnibacterium sp. CER49]